MDREKFIWNDTYKVEVSEIDEQHRHFFEIANSIFGLLDEDHIPAGELIPKIEELGDYALYHLSTEESYFEQFHYEEAQTHIREHDLFRQRIIKYIDKTKSPGVNISNLAGEIAGFAGSWLKEHILKTDKRYANFFHKHGLN